MAVENELVLPAAAVRSPGLPLALVIQLRPRQWIKNLACFAGLIFSKQLTHVPAIAGAIVAFASFCCASSAIYILNDIVDREKDRHNPRTATRPLASGALPMWVAVAAMTVLAALALVGAALLDGWVALPRLLAQPMAGASDGRAANACLFVLLFYVGLNVFYTFRLKHTVIADVMCIAIGFVLRVAYGIYAVDVPPTSWAVLCMFFLALFLGFAKRKAELGIHGDTTEAIMARPVLNKYNRNFLDILMAMSATMTIVCYGLFTVSPDRNPTLIVTIVPVVYCIMRYMLQVLVLGRGESPEKILFSDRMLWAGVMAWVLMCVAVLYGQFHLFQDVVRPRPEPAAAARP